MECKKPWELSAKQRSTDRLIKAIRSALSAEQKLPYHHALTAEDEARKALAEEKYKSALDELGRALGVALRISD